MADEEELVKQVETAVGFRERLQLEGVSTMGVTRLKPLTDGAEQR